MPISAARAFYIKLGEKGKWESLCFADNTLRLGYFEVPHELGQERAAESIRSIYLAQGKTSGVSATHANQVLNFYDTRPDTLWITFANGKLYWCFAQPDIEYIGSSRTDHCQTGSRLRRCIGSWSTRTENGDELRIVDLPGNLTKTAGYRQTICELKIEMVDYLVRRINGDEIEVVKQARVARKAALSSMSALIRQLHPKDFELYVDLVFSNSGWRRAGSVGSTQRTIDMEMVLPSTLQRAFVQVKSETNQLELERYLEQLSQRTDDFMFYAFHSTRGPLRCADERVRLLDADALSDMGMRAGLFDWLLQKA